MTSEPPRAFVWVWLPGADEPLPAGRLDRVGPSLTFTYGRRYLAREDAVALFLPELPLTRGPIMPLVGEAAGVIADAAPDSWGQRVILNHLVGRDALDTNELGLLTYLLHSGSQRIGALDFQDSANEYVPRGAGGASLAELADAAQRVEAGIPLSPALDRALLHGSSLGGARPKALLSDHGRSLIAKFSSNIDHFPVVKGEFVAMRLAHLTGLNVAHVALSSALGRDVLLVERFDRPAGGGRRMMVSALTILGLDEIAAPYASYADLAQTVRARFTEPSATLRELFARITFNILVSNNDDHGRNHAAFWDGAMLTLTPAYDICPQPRAGGETAQAMAIGPDGGKLSRLASCVEHASTYLLTSREARETIDRQVDAIRGHWTEVCDEAGLSEVDRAIFWRRQFLNPYAFEGYPQD